MKPKRTEWTPNKDREYTVYLIWKSLPRNPVIEQEVLENFALNDLEKTLLNRLKTQGDFAKQFGLHPSTLTEWNQRAIPEEFARYDWRDWAKELTKEVVFALYQGIIEHKDAARVRLWFQLVDPDALKRPNETKKSNEEEIFNVMNEIVEQLTLSSTESHK